MPPFLLCLLDSGEIRFFPDLNTLESAIEAIDVANGEYLGYDSAGYVVSLTLGELGVPKAVLSTVLKASELRAWILENYESTSGISNERTLPEMIDLLRALYRYDDK